MWLPQWPNYSCPLVERSKSSFSVSWEMLTLNFLQFNRTIQLFGIKTFLESTNHSYFLENGEEAFWCEGHDILSLIRLPTCYYNWHFWQFHHFSFQRLLPFCVDGRLVQKRPIFVDLPLKLISGAKLSNILTSGHQRCLSFNLPSRKLNMKWMY